ncbi:MAG TPA: FtsX-like permease family protein [Anaeromyxobacteraceae bacterium]|nr:FtsX-like permease family protein [Anaeromyxobacteraceae bacterium]
MALRFLREGRAQTALILGGSVVGVAVIIFVSALVGGLELTLVDKTLSSQAHVTLKRPDRVARVLPAPPGLRVVASVERAPERQKSVEQWQRQLAVIRGREGVVAATPTAAGSAFASRGELSRSVALRGVEVETFDAVVRIAGKMVAGRFSVEGTQAVVGSVLASDLGLSVGDKLRVVSTEGRGEIFTVAGVFDLGNKDVNQRWVLVSLRQAQTLLDLAGGVTTIEAKVADVFAADRVAGDLAAATGLGVESWMGVNQQLLSALRAQHSSAVMIQAFVVFAVALGIASVLGVSVLQRARQIGILKATGTPTASVLRIFLAQGALVGIAGSLGGGLLGSALAAFFQLTVKNPYGEALFPMTLTPRLFLGASAVAIATGLLAAVFPARRAALLDPATVIRNG